LGTQLVVLAVIVRFPIWPERVFSLPILVRLYLNKKAAAKWKVPYRTQGELALEMINLLCKPRKNRRFHVIADGAYGTQKLLAQLPDNCDPTSTLHMDARLYEAAPPRTGQRGRPRKRGRQLPTPEQMLAGRRRRLKMKLYGRGNCPDGRLSASIAAAARLCRRRRAFAGGLPATHLL
jgi:hypothetical protein